MAAKNRIAKVDLSLLPVLKEKLHKEKKLADVWDFFMTNFGDHESFIKKSEEIREHELIGIIGKVLCMIFHVKMLPIEWRIMGYSKYHFYHGIASTPKGHVNFIYFDDIYVGSTLHFEGFFSGETRFCRFVCERQADGSLKPSMN